MAILAIAVRAERIAKEVEALAPSIANRGLRLVEGEPEPGHHLPRPRQSLGLFTPLCCRVFRFVALFRALPLPLFRLASVRSVRLSAARSPRRLALAAAAAFASLLRLPFSSRSSTVAFATAVQLQHMRLRAPRYLPLQSCCVLSCFCPLSTSLCHAAALHFPHLFRPAPLRLCRRCVSSPPRSSLQLQLARSAPRVPHRLCLVPLSATCFCHLPSHLSSFFFASSSFLSPLATPPCRRFVISFYPVVAFAPFFLSPVFRAQFFFSTDLSLLVRRLSSFSFRYSFRCASVLSLLPSHRLHRSSLRC